MAETCARVVQSSARRWQEQEKSKARGAESADEGPACGYLHLLKASSLLIRAIWPSEARKSDGCCSFRLC